MTADLREYRGCLHVHSTFSDGSGGPEEIARAAGQAGIDFVVLSDHNNLDARSAGFEGWIGGVLMIVGVEVSAGLQPHVVALDVGDVDRVRHTDVRQTLEAIRDSGGFAILAHPQGQHRMRFRLPKWTDWNASTFDAVELWCYMHDWIKDFRFHRIREFHREAHSKITGPHPEVLRRYDEACTRRRVVALGALDAHARRVPLLGLNFFPYADSFATIRTHVLCRPLTGDAERDVPTIIDALRAGRCFMSFHVVGQADGFNFCCVDGAEVHPMGSELRYRAGQVLEVASPLEADMALMCGGRQVAGAQGKALRFAVEQAGAYRVELRRAGRPWVYSNPVYLREEGMRLET